MVLIKAFVTFVEPAVASALYNDAQMRRCIIQVLTA